MAILSKMRESRAIKTIARNLPPFLVQGYGGGEYYTYGQVSTAMEQTGCNSDYLDYACAMFCDRETFSEVGTENYDQLREDVAEICFNGESGFSFSDAASFSSDSMGSDNGGYDGGGGDGDGGGD